MRKLHLFFFAFFILLVAFMSIQIVLFRSANKKSQKGEEKVKQTTHEDTLKILSTKPTDRAINISLTEPIILSFNKILTLEDITFTLFPLVSITSEIKEKNIVLTPQEPYTPGTTYTLVVRYQNSDNIPDSFSFTTTGPTPLTQPDTQPKGASEKEDNFQKVNHPDVFLSNQVPYETDMFSIESEYASTPSGHFYFLVVLKGPDYDAAQKSVLAWIQSLGLTKEQIQQLDIR